MKLRGCSIWSSDVQSFSQPLQVHPLAMQDLLSANAHQSREQGSGEELNIPQIPRLL